MFRQPLFRETSKLMIKMYSKFYKIPLKNVQKFQINSPSVLSSGFKWTKIFQMNPLRNQNGIKIQKDPLGDQCGRIFNMDLPGDLSRESKWTEAFTLEIMPFSYKKSVFFFV